MRLRNFLFHKTHKLVITIAVVVGLLTIGSLPFFSRDRVKNETIEASAMGTGHPEENVIDFGSSDPFDHEGAIMGGADRPITVTAKHPGCYTYSIGACTAGTIYGMCGNRLG